MKIVGAFVLVAVAGLSTASADHPIAKVITLLEGLSAKVESEGKAEALTYEKFEYWCGNSVKTLAKAIGEGKATIDKLESEISSGTENAASLSDQIKKLEKEIVKLETSAGGASKVRDDTNAVYVAAEADYTSTIAAISDALAALERARDDSEAVSLVQKAIPHLSAGATDQERSLLASFVRGDPADVKAMGDREAHVDKYASKSHTVIELLKQLQAKFEAEKLDATKAETNSLNAYELSKNARDAAQKAAEDSKAEKESLLGDVTGQVEEAKISLASTQADLEADSESLKDTQQSCRTKQDEWNARSATRAGEMEAIAAAVKILAKSSGVRTEAPSNPVPPPSPVDAAEEAAPSLLEVVDPKTKAVNLLRAEARAVHSRALEQFAQEVAAHLTGPFDKVNNMIEKMIFRLMAEQKDEDDHKNWCDMELAKTNASIEHKTDKKEEITAKLDEQRAAVQKLSDDIQEANDMVASIVSHNKMATEIRETGRKENALALKDAEDAMLAISNAISVLREFYKSSGQIPKESWEFLQRGVDLPESPAMWGSSYTGVADAQGGDGIITVLEAVSADFSTMASETQAQEATDQRQFDEDMKASKIEKARRESQSSQWGSEMKRRSDKIESLGKSLKHTEGELSATEQYLEDLQPACVTGDSTYEDRKANRQKEVDALHEAQGILADAFKEEDAKPASFHLRKSRSVSHLGLSK